MDTLPSEIAPAALAASSGALHRRPALPGFLARKMIATRWQPTYRRAIVEACRAEIDWSVSDWRRLNPHWNGWNHEAAMLAQPHRLPHEVAAARVLNCWGHVQPLEMRIRDASMTLKAQVAMASDTTQSAGTRLSWTNAAAGTRQALRTLLAQLRNNYPIFLRAVKAYRAEREEIGPMTEAA